MTNNIYGYIRVSTKNRMKTGSGSRWQNFPVPKDNIFMDKLSGKDFNPSLSIVSL